MRRRRDVRVNVAAKASVLELIVQGALRLGLGSRPGRPQLSRGVSSTAERAVARARGRTAVGGVSGGCRAESGRSTRGASLN